MGEAPGLETMITAFAERVPAVAHAAIMSSDGLPLACSRGFPADLADQLAAITSGLCSLVQGAARIFEGGPVVQTVVVMDRGLMIVRGVTPSTGSHRPGRSRLRYRPGRGRDGAAQRAGRTCPGSGRPRRLPLVGLGIRSPRVVRSNQQRG